MAEVFCIGVERDVRAEWESLLAPIVAPSNYRDEQKIEAYIEKEKVKQEFTAKSGILTGKVTRAIIFRAYSEEPSLVIEGDNADVEFARFLANSPASSSFVALGLREMMQQATAVMLRNRFPLPKWIATSAFSRHNGFVDPITFVKDASHLLPFMQFLNSEPELPGTAEAQVEFCIDIATRIGEGFFA